MKHHGLNISIGLCFLMVVACSTPQADLRISTDPESSDVYILKTDGQQELLGSAPLVLTDKMQENLGSGVWRLGVGKKGFLREQLFLESKMFKEIGQIHVRLLPEANWSEAYQDSNAYKYLNDVSSVTAEVQAATLRGDYGKAMTLANSLVTRYPKLSVGWNLLGNIYYLQKNIGKATESYQKALEVNPQDELAKSTLERLKRGGL